MTKYYWVTRDEVMGYVLWSNEPNFKLDVDCWEGDGYLIDFCVNEFHALTNIRLPKGKKGIMRIKGFRVVK